MMRYGSVCSGIEAASVAWHTLGWRAAFFSEIDAFPRAVLAHHYPDVPLHGDFTTIREGQYAAIDVLVGGTPCQSFSVAGLRAGLDDERGNLALEFCLLARRLGPKWVVWENVPGVLSLDGGRAFASILGGLAECGYGLAYRVLDAQFVRVDGFGRAVPQRRRRVFVVGCLGDWRRAAAVLFERQSLSWDSPPRREAGQRPSLTLAARTRGGGGLGTDFDLDGGLLPDVSKTLAASRGAACANAEDLETYLPEHAATLTRGAESAGRGGLRRETSGRRREPCCPHPERQGGAGLMDFESETLVAHSLRGGGFDASEDGTGRGTPLVPVQGVALRGRENGATAELTGDVMTALRCGGGGGDKAHVLLPMVAGTMPAAGETERKHGHGWGQQEWTSGYCIPVAFAENSRAEVRMQGGDGQIAPQLTTGGGKPGQGQPCIAFNARQAPDVFNGHCEPLDTDGSTQGVLSSWRVRRLTPTECESLQGFPPNYTAIPYRGKQAADGPRYKALGNSMACNVMRWIGQRISIVDQIREDEARSPKQRSMP